MNFNDYLATFANVDDLSGLNVISADGQLVHHIPAVTGKLGSLKLYNALAAQFNGVLNVQAAEQGLTWFAEHVEDAVQNPGKHPNVDLLIQVQNNALQWRLEPISK
ncbi:MULTISPECIES: DUF2322 family protein [Vitreoscilla]|uniref:DUF2322 family protein n=1 Tax=Vitreoscilla stercoraria TaxID=61 RepID=A0ABY4EBQ8_VITST|nr:MULTISPECIES: DUF2322 family protein [Vitreoscilla]AUZ04217.1 hypothetical protein ADP71_04200 [Vitreoscilla sp. C1]UOO92028.1 DUF2322 family protein [Vitreoscilla stercoraria]